MSETSRDGNNTQEEESDLPNFFKCTEEVYMRFLKQYPLLVKSLTAGCTAALGSILGQILQQTMRKSRKIPHIKWRNSVNWVSVSAMASHGMLFTGPLVHFWLEFLRFYGPQNLIVRTILDRTLFSGPFTYILLFYVSFFNRIVSRLTLYSKYKNIIRLSESDTSSFISMLNKEVVSSCKKSHKRALLLFWNVLVTGWKFWVPVMFVVFQNVPHKLRPLASNTAGVLWSMILSYRAL